MAAAPPLLQPSDRFALRWNDFPDNVTAIFRWETLCVCECHACLQAAAAGRATCRRDTHVCWRKAGEGKSRIWSIHSGIYGVNTVEDNPTSSVRKIPENSARCKVQPTSICVINEIQLFQFPEPANSCRCRCGHTRWFCLPPAPSSASSSGTTPSQTHGSS